MSDEILGPSGDHLALRNALWVEDGESVPITGRVFLERLLERLLDEPGVREQLYELARTDPLGPCHPAGDPALVRYLSERIEAGDLRMGDPRGWTRWYLRERPSRSGLREVVEPATSESGPQEAQELVKDWHWECSHHTAPFDGRGQTHRQAWGRVSVDGEGRPIHVIGVVPNSVSKPDGSGPGEEEVHFYWRDDERGSPPKPALYLTTAGQPEREVKAAGSEAGYTKYSFKTPYLGGQDALRFFLPSFWDEFLHTTKYRLEGGPQPLRIDVYHPRKYKFTLKMPPLAGYKRGVKLGDSSADPRKLATPQKLERKMTEEASIGWGPSKLKLTRESDEGLLGEPNKGFQTEGTSDSKREYGAAGHAIKGAADMVPIRFSRDDVAVDPAGLLTMIASILRFCRWCFGIIQAVKDYAPEVGFYADFALEIMTGELAVEWMWKEFEDHRVYPGVDVNAKLTVFKVSLELGVGVKGRGMKLQVFAQVEGALDLSISLCRTSPDGDRTIPLVLKRGITGAIGARAEAGCFVKLEGKGQTGFELVVKVVVGIGGREPPVRFEITPAWLGLSFTGTFSAGAFGVSYEKTGTYKLVDPMALSLVKIPGDKPYRPPVMSKHDIARVFKNTFYKGIDVLVYREREFRDSRNRCPNPKCPGHGSPSHYCRGWDSGDWDGWIPIEPICDQLAEAVMADKGFTQTPKDIEALAVAVRMDFRDTSRMARSQVLGRNYVDYHDVQAYIAGGTVRGCSLRRHLDAGRQDPMLSQPLG